MLVAITALQAQTPCGIPQCLLDRSPDNFFIKEQEVYLGDVIANQIDHNFRILDAPTLLAPLNRITERLRSRLPSDELKFRFALIDLPQANAFALPGGRIYISRKLIALTRDENELASIVAHEMGHILAGQSATAISTMMRRVLKLDKLGDRQDVADQYIRLWEEDSRSPKGRGKNAQDREQTSADRIGLYVLAAAGYDPEAMPRVIDRLAQLKGDNGNFFTDLLGMTKSEGRRMREMLKSAAAVPAGCTGQAVARDAQSFASWQVDVAEYERKATSNALPGLLSDRALAPRLTASMTHVRFSPDASHVLAQDPSAIHVFTVSPLKLKFDIPAWGARPAEFTPDSQAVVFATDTLRVERWETADGARTLLHEMQIPSGCEKYDVSPDGAVFACVDAEATLRLIGVETDDVILERKHTVTGVVEAIWTLLTRSVPYEMGFSPDGKYFLGSPTYGSEDALLFDIEAGKRMSLSSAMHGYAARGFAFLSKDRLVALDPEKTEAIIEFPSGKVLEKVTRVAGGRVSRLSNPAVVLVHPCGKYAACVNELASQNVIMESSVPALDKIEDKIFAERGPGDLALYGPHLTILGTAQLRDSQLAKKLPGAFSPELDRMVISNERRAMIWNFQEQNSGQLQAFDMAAFADSDSLLLGTRPLLDEARVAMKIDVAKRAVTSKSEIAKDGEKTRSEWVAGRRVIRRQEPASMVLECQDPAGGHPGWSKSYNRAPTIGTSLSPDSIVLSWLLNEKPEAIIGKDAKLPQGLSKSRKAGPAWLVQIVDAATGEQRWLDVVDGFERPNFAVAGDYLLVSNPDNRLAIRRWKDGSTAARTFGRGVAFHAGRGRLAIQNIDSELRILDPANGAELERLQFAAPVVLAGFSRDGGRMAVVTSDQHVLTLTVP